MITENEEHGFLMGIPDEIWEKILKGMSSGDVANFRSVNKKCKDLAEKLFNRWIIRIDYRNTKEDKEKEPYLETLLDLRVEELRIVHLFKPLPFRPPGVILRYPDMLKVLRTSEYKTIAAEQLHVLLKSKNLEQLVLKLDNENINKVYSDPPAVGYDFRKVKMMTININHEEKTQLLLIDGNFLQRIVKRSIFSNLNFVDINIRLGLCLSGNDYRTSCDVLEFIVKYGNTLKSVKYDIRGGMGLGFPIFLESVDEARLQNCSKLNSLQVYSRLLHGTWRSLLMLQMQLVDLKFSMINIPMSLFNTVIERNYNTLGSIEIDRLEVDEELIEGIAVRLFDFAIFLNCSNLRKLGIDCSPLAEARNLQILHEKIEYLALGNIRCCSEELFRFSSIRPELKTLYFKDPGKTGRFGINGSVLENLLALSELSDLRFFGDSINRSDPSEAVKLERMGWNIPPTKLVIVLEKDPNTHLWIQKC